MNFWQYIASQIGSARLQINKDADSINDFIDPDCGFIKDIIRTSYSKSKCYHLQSSIDLNLLLDSLGEHAYQLNEKLDADLFDIELLEEIAWHIGERFLICVKIQNQSQKKTSAQVISLPDAKIRRANALL